MTDPRQIVLDTHAWVWLMSGVSLLSSAARDAIDDAARVGAIRITAISAWEVAMLERRNRLTLSRPVLEWIHSALAAPGVSLAPLTPEIAVDSCNLPGEPPRDPADRLIIATARARGAHIVTRDAAIIAYAQEGHVRALET